MKNIKNNFEPIYLVGSNNELKRDYGELKYKFRLTGVPPNQAIQLVNVDPNSSIAELKIFLIRAFRLNPILAIQLIFKGKILPDNIGLRKVGFHPNKDVITVMSTQGGG
ncbi:hypothetical protein LCGC14_0764570 [marine sediment metagenome]|uniref:Ubiquitin-like domain-containing protein n=1 Tax=marine sediment metagenome TaxID=412755 RepID=A0A0F9SKB3_9ZZZZ